MRTFHYYTAGRILELLKSDGLKISRATLYRLEKDLDLPTGRSSGKWRVYSKEEADIIVYKIKVNYGYDC